jgi:uncharacterized membrane protein
MIPRGVRLRTAWDALRTSFWFVPALMGVGGGLVTALSLMLERTASASAQSVPWFVYVGAPDDARTVVSTLLSSMMTMVSLVFSITIVVLTLAANQFGPRLIRNFMASPQTQLVLGTFIMTIVHCLLALSAIGWRQEDEPLPFFTVSAAILLSLISVGLLVLHLHVLARSIMSETVIARVGAELDDTLDSFGRLQASQPDPKAALPHDFHELARFSGPGSTGYVRAIEFDRLVDAARQADVLIGLTFRAGEYVVADSDGVGIYPGDRATPEPFAAVADAVEVGTDRTPVQDPDFGIRHLVEIAVRALSPGINDPYTAIAAINQLSASLARLMDRNLPDARPARPGRHASRALPAADLWQPDRRGLRPDPPERWRQARRGDPSAPGDRTLGTPRQDRRPEARFARGARDDPGDRSTGRARCREPFGHRPPCKCRQERARAPSPRSGLSNRSASPQTDSLTMSMAPQGHSAAQMPQPLQ